MKKIFILIVLLTAWSGGAKAQVQFSFGPGLGFNYTMYSFPNSDQTFDDFGILGTSQFDMQFSRSLGVLVWMDFYSDLSAKVTSGTIQGKYKINYFSLAPTLKFCIPGSHFYLFGGPGLGFKTQGRVFADYGSFSVENEIYNMQLRTEFHLGAGYEFFLTNKLTLTSFAKFNAGLNSISTDFDGEISALQIGIVLRYNTF